MLQDFLQNPISDEDFLSTAISHINFLCKAMPKQMISIKQCDFTLVFCSDYFAQLVGIKAEEILGIKYWSSLYDDDPSFEKIIFDEDQAVIDSRSQKTVLKINHFKKGIMPYLCIKTPIINPSTNNVVGLVIQGFEIGASNLLQKIINPTNTKSNKAEHLPHLSKREKQVIFFFLANLSSQAIADMIYQLEGKQVSKSTIDSLFNEQLYVKFDVHSRPALYKKLQDLGYETMIPNELLSNNSILLDTINIY